MKRTIGHKSIFAIGGAHSAAFFVDAISSFLRMDI